MNFGNVNAKYENQASMLLEQWTNEGIMEGVNNEIAFRGGVNPNSQRAKAIAKATAVMLENQSHYNEQITGSGTGTDDVAVFRRNSIPMVRRAFPQLIAHHVVGVQPMLGPSALIFYLRFRAGVTKGNQSGTGGADGVGDVKWPNSGWDDTSLQQAADGTTRLPIWYTHERVNRETRSGSGSATQTYSFGYVPVKEDGLPATTTDAADIPSITAGTSYTAFGKVYDGATLVYYFRISGTTVTTTAVGSPSVAINSATFNSTTGILTIVWASDPGATSLQNLTYAYNMECNASLPSVNATIESHTVNSMTRKLRFQWSNEAQMDVRSQHNMDLESEFLQFASTELALETDREILADLRDNAGTVTVWDFASATGDTIKERYESLYVKLVETSNQIRKKTLRGEANFIVCSPEIAAIFQSATAGFAPAPTDGFQTAIGIQYIGTINSRYRVFIDPDAPSNQILLGYRGDSAIETGYFYCPYVAMTQSELMVDPNSGCLTRIMMTRYGKALLREGGRFYARVQITNFIV
jgi:hypothetical protein